MAPHNPDSTPAATLRARRTLAASGLFGWGFFCHLLGDGLLRDALVSRAFPWRALPDRTLDHRLLAGSLLRRNLLQRGLLRRSLLRGRLLGSPLRSDGLATGRRLLSRHRSQCRRRRIAGRPKHLLQPLRHLVELAFSVDRPQDAVLAVELDQRLRLLVIHLQSFRHRRLVVVRALEELVGATGRRTGLALGLPRRAGQKVEDAFAVRAGAASGNAARQLAVVHVHLHHEIQWLSQLFEQGIQRLSLCDVAREAIEDESGLCIGLAQALPDHVQHNLVVDESAGIHSLFHFVTQLGVLLARDTQQISSGDLGDAETLDETLRLGALAGAGRPQENDTHSFLKTDPYPERLATLPAAPLEVKLRGPGALWGPWNCAIKRAQPGTCCVILPRPAGLRWRAPTS